MGKDIPISISMLLVSKTFILMTGLLIALALSSSSNIVRADVEIYPGDNNIFNVTAPEYGAVPNDNIDDTAAIQKAIDDILARKVQSTPQGDRVSPEQFTLYFPAGVYRVSASLTFGSRVLVYGTPPTKHELQTGIHVKGDGIGTSVIRLTEGSFTDASAPKPVFSFFDGPDGNDLYTNTIEDISIFVANNNAGAIGLRYMNNNCGYIRRVKINSGDRRGVYGVDLGSSLSGIGLVKNLEVIGFDYGIANLGGTKHTYVLENIKLSQQRQAGILTRNKGLSIRRLTSANTVPALLQEGNNSGQVMLLDSTLQGGASANAAIDNRTGWLLVRGVTTSGYGSLFSNPEREADLGGGEYVTGGVEKLWDDAPSKTLNLPIEETPEVARDPQSEWAVIDTNTPGPDGNAADDTDIIQQAIDSGKTTVFLKRGKYTLGDTVYIRGGMRRLNWNWSFIETTQAMAESAKPAFQFEDGAHPVVVFEALYKILFDYPKTSPNNPIWFMQHNASRTLVMRDMNHVFNRAYRNTGTGKLFVENIFSKGNDYAEEIGWQISNGQKAWFRQINHEGNAPNLVNDGGQVWILGTKMGEGGPYTYFRMTGGGRTEVLGAVFNRRPSNPPADATAIEIVDSDVSISVFETAQGTARPYPITVRETRDGVTRTLTAAQLPTRQGLTGKVLPLYRSYGAPHAVTITAMDDAYVRDSQYASTNFGTDNLIPLKTGPTGYNRDGFLKFDISSVCTITKAELHLYAALSSSGNLTPALYTIPDTTWTEGTITWNNKPGADGRAGSITVNSTAFQTYTIDVTAYVQAQKQSGKTAVSFALHIPSQSTSNLVHIYTKESGVKQPPRLVITQ